MTIFFRKRKKTLIGIAISLLAVGCLIIANYASIFILPAQATTENISSTEFDLHFLTLAKSQVESEANSHAPDYRKIGAGGVVWQNENYNYIVSSAYSNKNDAILVQSNLKQVENIESEIILIKFKSISISGSFLPEEKKIITNAFSASQNFYNSIYDIAISLDTGVYNEISAKLAVNSAHNTLAKVMADFITIYPSPSMKPFSEIYNLLKELCSSSQKLCTGEKISEGQTYSSLLKYRYLEVLKIYYEFLEKF